MNMSKLLMIAVLSFALALGSSCGCGKGKKSRESGEDTGQKQVETGTVSKTAEGEADSAMTSETWEVPEGTGAFYVGSTYPGAGIVINGRSVMEKTPHLFSAEPGQYEVAVALEGFSCTPEVLRVDVADGSADSLIFKMEGQPLSSFPLVALRDKEVCPRWSPDGKTIVYEAYYGGNRDIYTVPVAGGEHTRITFDQRADYSPCWSPNGKEIVFTSNRGGTVDLWVVDAAGAEEPRQLTTGGGAEENATFSPDGKWIAFESLSKIWKMPAKGGKMEQVTKGNERHFFPDWSPDGKEIAFTVQTDVGRQIWAVNVATGAMRKLVADKGWSYGPRWSPNGKVIVFVRRGAPPENNHDLWICSAQGGELTQITMESAADQYPCWSPNGRELAWAKNADLWVMTGLPDWLLGEAKMEGS